MAEPSDNKLLAARSKASIVHVERAMAELRRGYPVVITGNDKAALVAIAAEMLTDARLDEFRAMTGGSPALALTAKRAGVLHIPLMGPYGALVKLGGDMTAQTLQALADPAEDLNHPMMGPFRPSDMTMGPLHGAALQLAKYAQLLPAMLAGHVAAPDIEAWAKSSDLLIVSTQEINDFSISAATRLAQVVAARVPLHDSEKTRIVAFRPENGATEHIAIILGEPSRHEPVLARIHSECFTGDLVGSLKCDCGEQLRGAIREIAKAGGGVLLYLAQEGRGIGLINKLRAYRLQDQGFDTVEANERLGFDADERVFLPAAEILKNLGFSAVRLMTNNPDKVAGLEACGITVTERVEHKFPSNNHNEFYLATKKKRSGHYL